MNAEPRPNRPHHQPTTTASRRIRALVRAIRPRQWTKNLLVFLPLLFTINEAWSLDDFASALPLIARSAAAAALFCLLSAAMYLLNDSLDAENDRAHPVKRRRPIAAGLLPARFAGALGAALGVALIYPSFVLDAGFGWVALAYATSQTAYSLGLKRAPLLDVGIVTSGFALRILAGATAISAPISPWLYVCSGLGALFVALCKRRSELARAGDAADRQRPALAAYTLPMLDQMISVVAAAALIGYSIYTFTAQNLPGDRSMMLTIPFVVYGMFRYIYLVHARDAGETPERVILTDAPMLASIALWLLASGAILSFGR